MKKVLACLALTLVLGACDSDEVPPTQIVEHEDPPGLDLGITFATPAPIDYTRETIKLTRETDGASLAASMPDEDAFECGDDGASELCNLTQQALVTCPMVETDEVTGQTGLHCVQANDIDVDAAGQTGYVAYNYQGNPWVGAIQILDLTCRDGREECDGDGDGVECDDDDPGLGTCVSIIEEIHFPHMDINALEINGNELLIGGAVNPAFTGVDESDVAMRSFAMVLNVVTLDLDAMVESMVILPSYAATGITRVANEVFVGTGALDGSIQRLDADLGDPAVVFDHQDIRDVDHHDNGIIAIAGGTDFDFVGAPPEDGMVIVASSNDFASATEITVPKFGVDEFGFSDYHKATIQVWEGTVALLGMSQAGAYIYDLRDPSAHIYHEPNPTAPGLLTNTNSVATDGALLFVGNGEYGFRVLRPKNKGEFDGYRVVGFYRGPDEPTDELESKYSANHVELKSNRLFVASGPRGVFVYSLDTDRGQG